MTLKTGCAVPMHRDREECGLERAEGERTGRREGAEEEEEEEGRGGQGGRGGRDGGGEENEG